MTFQLLQIYIFTLNKVNNINDYKFLLKRGTNTSSN
jgi:hypothetical protein